MHDLPLRSYAQRGTPEELLAYLHDGNHFDMLWSGGLAAIYAAEDGRIDNMEALLRIGVPVAKFISNRNQTALIIAAEYSQADAVQWLIKHGADVAIKDSDGLSPLLHAINRRIPRFLRIPLDEEQVQKCVELLLRGGAEIEDQDIKGSTALMFAAKNQMADVVRLLINHGALVNASNNKKTTALMWACTGSSLEIVRMLVEAGADIHAMEPYLSRRSPLRNALYNKYGHIVDYLLEQGSDPMEKDERGLTTLDWAKGYGLETFLPT